MVTPRGGTPAAESSDCASWKASAAALALGVPTGTSATIAPVPSCSQTWASPITSARCSADRPPRAWPTKITTERLASWIAIGYGGDSHRGCSPSSSRPHRYACRRQARLRDPEAPPRSGERAGIRRVSSISFSRPRPALVRDKAVGAAIALARFVAAGNAGDAIDVAEQVGLRIGCRDEAVIRTRQILLRDRAHDIGRHDHHQLGLAVQEVAAAKQG